MNIFANNPTFAAKLSAAKSSLTVWLSAAVPVLLAAAETLKDQLPGLAGLVGGWTMVLLSVLVSMAISTLRLRGVTAPAPGGEGDASAAGAAGGAGGAGGAGDGSGGGVTK